jgi:crossover junction endodeoxyribonuclease RuvC
VVTIGVDPGASGALTLRVAGAIKDIKDMPVVEVKVGKTMRKRVNAALLAALLRDWRDLAKSSAIEMYCEKVGPMPKDGGAAAFAFGAAFGAVQGVAAGLSIPLTLVSPGEWHRLMQCTRDKNGNRARACQLYPQWAGMFARVKDDGRAESALIADYGDRITRDMLG